MLAIQTLYSSPGGSAHPASDLAEAELHSGRDAPAAPRQPEEDRDPLVGQRQRRGDDEEGSEGKRQVPDSRRGKMIESKNEEMKARDGYVEEMRKVGEKGEGTGGGRRLEDQAHGVREESRDKTAEGPVPAMVAVSHAAEQKVDLLVAPSNRSSQVAQNRVESGKSSHRKRRKKKKASTASQDWRNLGLPRDELAANVNSRIEQNPPLQAAGASDSRRNNSVPLDARERTRKLPRTRGGCEF